MEVNNILFIYLFHGQFISFHLFVLFQSCHAHCFVIPADKGSCFKMYLYLYTVGTVHNSDVVSKKAGQH